MKYKKWLQDDKQWANEENSKIFVLLLVLPFFICRVLHWRATVIALLLDTAINLHEVTPNVCANSSKWKHTPLWNSWILVMPFSWKLTSKTTFFYCFAVWTSIYCWTDLYETNTCLSKCSYQCLTSANLPLRTCFSEREIERMYCTDVVCWLVIDGSPMDQRVLLWQTWVEVNCRFLVMYNQRHKVQTNRCKETAVCWGWDQVCPDTVGKVAALSLFAFGLLLEYKFSQHPHCWDVFV